MSFLKRFGFGGPEAPKPQPKSKEQEITFEEVPDDEPADFTYREDPTQAMAQRILALEQDLEGSEGDEHHQVVTEVLLAKARYEQATTNERAGRSKRGEADRLQDARAAALSLDSTTASTLTQPPNSDDTNNIFDNSLLLISMKKSFLPLSLLSLILIGGGCFNAVSETAIERGIESETGGSADVDVEDDAITYTDEETGATVRTGTDISLPADFPEDFFVYEGDITIISAANVPNEGVSLMFSSEDSLDEVVAWYEAELTADGWVKSQGYALQGSVVQGYTKGELMTAISLSESSGKTTGTVTRSQQ